MHPLIFKEVLPSIIMIFFAFACLRHIATVRTLLLLLSNIKNKILLTTIYEI
jgi:hypothetical protein